MPPVPGATRHRMSHFGRGRVDRDQPSDRDIDAATTRGGLTERHCPLYSSGSILRMAAWWLLSAQKVTGVVVSSMKMRRMLFWRVGSYSTAFPVLGSKRSTRSFDIEPAHSSSFRSR